MDSCRLLSRLGKSRKTYKPQLAKLSSIHPCYPGPKSKTESCGIREMRGVDRHEILHGRQASLQPPVLAASRCHPMHCNLGQFHQGTGCTPFWNACCAAPRGSCEHCLQYETLCRSVFGSVRGCRACVPGRCERPLRKCAVQLRRHQSLMTS